MEREPFIHRRRYAAIPVLHGSIVTLAISTEQLLTLTTIRAYNKEHRLSEQGFIIRNNQAGNLRVKRRTGVLSRWYKINRGAQKPSSRSSEQWPSCVASPSLSLNYE